MFYASRRAHPEEIVTRFKRALKIGGIALGTLWGSDATFEYPDDGRQPPPSTWFPPVGGVRFIEFVLPPGSDPEQGGGSAEGAAAAERLAPGLLSHFTDDAPGMHS